MFECQRNEIQQEVNTIVRKYGRTRNYLLPILQELNRKFSYINNYMIEAVSNALDISPAEVHGVVAFYSFLNESPKGKYIIRLCKTISCDMAGKDRIVRVLEKELGISFGETTKDGLFSLEYTNCIGMCNEGPAMLVNDEVYSKLCPEKVVDILEFYKNGARKRA